MILIKNGSIVENNQLVKKDILIVDNKIEKIEDNISKDCQVLDAKGCLIMPGGVDVHVHFREPGYSHKETIKTGTLSAAKGGFTSVMPMPNLNPCPDSYQNLKVELDIIDKDAVVNCYPYGSVSCGEKGNERAKVEELQDLVYAISDDGVGVNNIDLLEDVMHLAKKYDLVIASHAEDKVNGYLPEGEYKAVRREIELAKKIGCRYHFCHMSTKESFEAIRKARSEGYTNITCEVAPHHLVLNKDMIKDANFKMNPPLRDESDRLATVEALIDGTALMVASDHAPHTKEEKSREYDKCPNGIIGLETMIPIIYTHFVKSGIIDLNRFLNLLVYNPIEVFKLPKRDLKEGFIADIAVIDIENPHTYKEDEILSMGKNSPFIGNTYYGFTKYTIVNGKIVYSLEE
ncbi:MAG: dihydroorotase [Acholeplasmatales bacterium]|nr:dihydroorotase [Acholeplasmatales bacterium]